MRIRWFWIDLSNKARNIKAHNSISANYNRQIQIRSATYRKAIEANKIDLAAESSSESLNFSVLTPATDFITSICLCRMPYR